MRTIIPNEEKARVTALEMQAERERKREWALERQANREAQVRIAEEAQIRRSQRNAGTLYERVQKAQARLEGMPAGAFVELLGSMSDAEREVFLLAEEYGQNREPLLKRFPAIRKATRTEYLQAVEAIDDATTPVDDIPPSEELRPAAGAAPKSRANRARKQEA